MSKSTLADILRASAALVTQESVSRTHTAITETNGTRTRATPTEHNSATRAGVTVWPKRTTCQPVAQTMGPCDGEAASRDGDDTRPGGWTDESRELPGDNSVGSCVHETNEGEDDDTSTARARAITPECRACGERCSDVLVCCLECKHYFCFSQPDTRPGGATQKAVSHWAYHLQRSKHQHAALYAGSDREWALRCIHCQTQRELPQLGFFSPVVWDEAGQTPLVCRLCAVAPRITKTYHDRKWTPLLCRDTDEFDPAFLDDTPQHACDQTDKRLPTAEELAQLELSLTLCDTQKQIETREQQQKLPPIPAQFDSAKMMRDCFFTVLEAESEAQRMNEANEKICGCEGDIISRATSWVVQITMVTAGSLTKLSEVVLEFETVSDNSGNALTWEGYVESIALVIPKDTTAETSYRCTIVVTKSMMGFPGTYKNHVFSIACKYGGVSFSRMRAVLERMTKELVMDASLFRTLLANDGGVAVRPNKNGHAPGHSAGTLSLIAGFKGLNNSQKQAVRHAIEHPMTLIQGPPGTGKTVTCTVIVELLQRLFSGKVLVCAGSNTAVDHLALHLINAQKKGAMENINILRVEAFSTQGNCSAEVMPNTLYHRTNAIIESLPRNTEIRALHRRKLNGDNNWEKVKMRYENLRREIELRVLRSADVVCSTCVTAGSNIFMQSGMVFSEVLMDEACQMLEPETWIPLQYGATRVVLVGDQCQLEPMVLLRKAKDAGLARSLFERLLSAKVLSSVMLAQQYRMHPRIAEFPSKTYYGGKLSSGISESERTPMVQPLSWPNPKVPILFIHVAKTGDERGPLNLSFRNRQEAITVVQIVLKLLENGVKPEDLGVISPYKAQSEYISSRIARHPKLGLGMASAIESSSVDKFQGREKKYIIHSCVRCNEERDIGFMYDVRRLNVSVTRAQYGLIFIGDVQTLWFATAHGPARGTRVPTQWRLLIRHFAETNSLVRPTADGFTPYAPAFITD